MRHHIDDTIVVAIEARFDYTLATHVTAVGVTGAVMGKLFVTQDDNSCVICAAGVARSCVSDLSHERKLLK